MADADIVVGYGRSVLEAMALGRAAYVWDIAGGDGWVTPETYPTLEADGFSGAATDPIIDADRMRADFASYGPELGAFGFDLVRNITLPTTTRSTGQPARRRQRLDRIRRRSRDRGPAGAAGGTFCLHPDSTDSKLKSGRCGKRCRPRGTEPTLRSRRSA